jgi:hypothetical protein
MSKHSFEYKDYKPAQESMTSKCRPIPAECENTTKAQP